MASTIGWVRQKERRRGSEGQMGRAYKTKRAVLPPLRIPSAAQERGVVFAHFLAQDRNCSAAADNFPSGQTAAMTSGLGEGEIRMRLRREPATQAMVRERGQSRVVTPFRKNGISKNRPDRPAIHFHEGAGFQGIQHLIAENGKMGSGLAH